MAKCPDERLRQGLLELADKTIEMTQGAARAYAARGQSFDTHSGIRRRHSPIFGKPLNWNRPIQFSGINVP